MKVATKVLERAVDAGCRWRIPAWAAGMLLLAILPAAQAQTFNVIYNFASGRSGANPNVGVTLDNSGNLYGTTYNGGDGYGTAFKLSPKNGSWFLTPLYSFKGQPDNDGAGPDSPIVIGRDGSLYGAAISGGPYTYCQIFGGYQGCGTVYNLRPHPTIQPSPFSPWLETQIYQFTLDPDGAYPRNNIAVDAEGNMYGTGGNGGNFLGVVWELSPSNGGWVEDPIYTFTNIDGPGGGVPESGIVLGSDGDLYGTNSEYGHDDNGCCGTVFQLVKSGSSWTGNVLYDFTNGADGETPYAGVIEDAAGNLYGATTTGGVNNGGTVYELSPNGQGGYNFQTIYSFTGSAGLATGPFANLVLDGAGNLYGTTYLDGRYGWGSVFKLTPVHGSWTYSSLHDFSGGLDGASPRCSLVFDHSGNLYGTTNIGGANGLGVIFEITP